MTYTKPARQPVGSGPRTSVRDTLLLVVTVVALTTTSSCASGNATSQHHANTAVSGPGATNYPTGPAPHGADDAGQPGPDATTSATPEALQAADAFVAAWARPNLDKAAWLAGIATDATPDYVPALATVDPTRIPAHRITGPATAATATPVAAEVDVPTDAGPVRVVLVMYGGQWLVADLRPGGNEQ